MSTEVNTILLERAAAMVDYWEGTTIARTIELNLHMNDLKQLEYNVNKAEGMAAAEEMFGTGDV